MSKRWRSKAIISCDSVCFHAALAAYHRFLDGIPAQVLLGALTCDVPAAASAVSDGLDVDVRCLFICKSLNGFYIICTDKTTR